MPRSKRMDNVVGTFYQNGRTHTVRKVTITCARCQQPHEVQMTTKAPKYCVECRVIVDAEKAVADAARKVAYAKRVGPRKKQKRKIKYAGWDPSEKHHD